MDKKLLFNDLLILYPKLNFNRFDNCIKNIKLNFSLSDQQIIKIIKEIMKERFSLTDLPKDILETEIMKYFSSPELRTLAMVSKSVSESTEKKWREKYEKLKQAFIEKRKSNTKLKEFEDLFENNSFREKYRLFSLFEKAQNIDCRKNKFYLKEAVKFVELFPLLIISPIYIDKSDEQFLDCPLYKLKKNEELYIEKIDLKIPMTLFNETLLELEFTDVKDNFKLPYNLPNLRSLGISRSGIEEITGEIKGFTKLEVLFLNNNPKFNLLSKEIGQLKNLKDLTLGRMPLTELPEEIGQLKNLKTLVLERIPLVELPEEIGQLKNLKILRLQNIPLTKFPKGIGKLKNLINIELINLDTTELPSTFGGLSSLVSITIEPELLNSFDKYVKKLKNLQSVTTSGVLPRNLEKMIHLKFYQLCRPRRN